MITLYTFSTPNGHKASIALEEAGLPYEVHRLDLMGREHRSPEYMKISPIGKLPAMMETVNGSQHRIFGSGAILLYVAEKTGKLLPKDPVRRIEAINWLELGVSDLGPAATELSRFALRAPEKLPYAIDLFKSELRRCYDAMEKQLNSAEYLAGEYSVADISAFPFVAATHHTKPQFFSSYTRIRGWYDLVAARPAVQRGMAVPPP